MTATLYSQTVTVFGYSNNIDNGVDTDLWSRANPTDDDDLINFPTQARVHDITSTSDVDSTGNAGATVVLVEGPTDWISGYAREYVTLVGTDTAVTAQSYVYINRFEVINYGTSGPNVGTITATAQTDNTITKQIPAAIGRSLDAAYAIPSNRIMTLEDLSVTVIQAVDDTMGVDLSIMVNTQPGSSVNDFVVVERYGARREAPVNRRAYQYISGPAILKLNGHGNRPDMEVSGSMIIKVETK